jgi:hypothetical protein
MTKIPLSLTLAISVAASLGFIAGYTFHLTKGAELPAARQALIESQAGHRVLDAYKEVLIAKGMYEALAPVNSVEQLQSLKSRSKAGTLETTDRFEAIAKEAADPRERFLAQQFMPSIKELRVALDAPASATSAPSQP